MYESTVLLALAGALATGQQPDRAGTVPGQHIVVFKDTVRDVPGLAYGLAGEHGRTPRFIYEHALNGFAAELPEQAIEGLSHNPDVAYVEADSVVWASGSQVNPTRGLDRIDQHALPLDKTYNYDYPGSGVTAYIIDTGIRITHNEFGGRARYGWDFVGNDAVADDCNGHGTHVAGTVGGTTYGVAKQVSLVAVRVLNCAGSGTTSGVIAGIDWVTADHNSHIPPAPAVANMSLGGGASTALDDAVKESIAAGISFAVAAGNSGADACNSSPSRVTEAMTIGATDSTDTKASWSNYGSCDDWFAPGVSITSAWYSSDTATNTISGTSMATPHTTGVAAMCLQAIPGASPRQARDALYAATTKGVVTSSSTANNHILYSLFDANPPANAPPMANFTFTTNGLTASFTDASTDAGGTTASAQNPSHSYALPNTYTVTLTVTDDGGATGAPVQQPVTVSSPTGGIALNAWWHKAGAVYCGDLTWSAAIGANVDIYRNARMITTTANDGSHTDKIGKRAGTYVYKVCEEGTSTCSNQATVTVF